MDMKIEERWQMNTMTEKPLIPSKMSMLTVFYSAHNVELICNSVALVT